MLVEIKADYTKLEECRFKNIKEKMSGRWDLSINFTAPSPIESLIKKF